MQTKEARVVTAEFREVLRAGARAAEATGRASEASVAALRESGLLAMMVPAEFGGRGWDAAAANGVIEQVASADPSMAIVLYLHCAVVARIDQYGSAQQRNDWLQRIARDSWLASSAWSEPGSSADKRTLSTTAREDPDGQWRVRGGKTFATSATFADFFIVLAQLPDPLAAHTARPSSGYGGSNQGLFLIPAGAPGVRIPAEALDMSGMRGSGTGMAEFRDVAVAAADLLCGPDETGLAIQLPHRMGLTLGAVSLGVAESAYDAAVEHLRSRNKLADAEVRARLARMAVTIEAARSMVNDLGARAPFESPMLAYAVKVFASTTSQEVCGSVRELLGSAGYLRQHEIHRVSRDSEAVTHMGPPNHLCLSLLGSELENSYGRPRQTSSSDGASESARSSSSR
jgi:alkylation response protein AidB-like acyl-CoA dehydrogenase